jgi:hypothetical protein
LSCAGGVCKGHGLIGVGVVGGACLELSGDCGIGERDGSAQIDLMLGCDHIDE